MDRDFVKWQIGVQSRMRHMGSWNSRASMRARSDCCISMRWKETLCDYTLIIWVMPTLHPPTLKGHVSHFYSFCAGGAVPVFVWDTQIHLFCFVFLKSSGDLLVYFYISLAFMCFVLHTCLNMATSSCGDRTVFNMTKSLDLTFLLDHLKFLIIQ